MHIHARYVMITGSGPGVGKSTLMEYLRARVELHDLGVELVPEGALFSYSLFRNLASKFRKHEPPSAAELIEAFSGLLDEISSSERIWIQDWSWIDLAEDLPWAKELQALEEYALRLGERAMMMNTLVLYLSMGVDGGLRRAEAQRGEEWILGQAKRVVGKSDQSEAMIAHYRAREDRLIRAFQAGGWKVHLLDASLGAGEVGETAFQNLISE